MPRYHRRGPSTAETARHVTVRSVRLKPPVAEGCDDRNLSEMPLRKKWELNLLAVALWEGFQPLKVICENDLPLGCADVLIYFTPWNFILIALEYLPSQKERIVFQSISLQGLLLLNFHGVELPTFSP